MNLEIAKAIIKEKPPNYVIPKIPGTYNNQPLTLPETKKNTAVQGNNLS